MAGTADLTAAIRRVKAVIAAGRLANEAAVRQAIVLPLLRVLGWDDGDPDRVAPEYELGGRRVDYALSAFGAQPSLFIEVKGPGPVVGVERQLFEYAFHAGIQFAVLTNGREWSFFLPTGAGSYDERLLYKLDLTERETAEAVERLSRYLGFEQVRSGEALKDAHRDYDDLHKGRIVRDALPRAWAQLLDEPDELLVDLVAERTASLCGFRPSPDTVAAFLASGAGSIRGLGTPAEPARRRRGPAMTPILPPTSARPVAAMIAPTIAMSAPTGGGPSPTDVAETGNGLAGGRLRYTFLGETRSARSANEILLHVARTLADRDGSFLERFALEARSKRRNHVARRAEDVYPERPQLLKYVVELVPGWYLGTNVSNRDKAKLLQAACLAARISYGSDLVVNLPNIDV